MKRATLISVCLLFGAVTVAAQSAPPTTTATRSNEVLCPDAADIESKIIHVVGHCVACTVGIVNRSEMPFGSSSGSGVVVSADGLILTAGHVITKPGTLLTVRFPSGLVARGVAVGLDHASDTGMARITDPAPAGGWPFAPRAASDSARLGEWVLALGNPGSILLDRDPPLRIGRVTGRDARMLRTNCAVEPGDSGGPLFDLDGSVVGINSRIMATSHDTDFSEYLSMHVPIGVFDAEWSDLLAGENAHPEVTLGKSFRRPSTGREAEAARFHEAMNKLVAAKDPEMLKLLSESQRDNGRLSMTPQLMHHLIAKAGLADSQAATTKPADRSPDANTPGIETPSPSTGPSTAPVGKGIASALRASLGPQIRKSLQERYPGAHVSDALLEHIMDKSTVDSGTGEINVATDDQDLKQMGALPPSAADTLRRRTRAPRYAFEAAKTSLQTTALFSPALRAAGDCLVDIRAGDKTVLQGTVVEADGFIVTKASDLPSAPLVVLPDGRSMPAQLIGKDTATDLALLKVSATGLTAAVFGGNDPVGSFVVAPMSDPNQPAVGVISTSPRPIPAKFTYFVGEQKLILGVGFTGQSLVVVQVTPGMPADEAGIKFGDEVLELNGLHVSGPADFLSRVKACKSGDVLRIKVRRNDQDIEFKPVLGRTRATTQTTRGIGETDEVAGGKLSGRRSDFPMAIQTDAAVWADQCGGPLIDLRGQTVGVTIARYDRACTFVIPASLVETTVAGLKSH